MTAKRRRVPEYVINGNPFYQLALQDPDTFKSCFYELERQRNGLELIASENITSPSVMAAQGSYLTNKYAEGYPKKRYYGGCEVVDEVEQQAIDRAKSLFHANYANVQPHSGTTANQIVFHALMKPNQKILSLGLDQGGHLSHGADVNAVGNLYSIKNYWVHKEGPEKGLIDMDSVRDMAKRFEPQVIVAGGSAYPRFINFRAFRGVADEIGAYLVVDMAHFAGLVAAELYPSPLSHAHVVTTTTHKTLRGPRGGLILTGKDGKTTKVWNKTQKKFTNLETALNSATFPGMQGGPLEHVIAAKSVAFQEALNPSGQGPSKEFVQYQRQVIRNAKAMADYFNYEGFDVATRGTDTHLILLKYPAGLNGKQSQHASEAINITTNKNSVPYDEEKPFIASGSRLGSPAATTRGLVEADFYHVARVLDLVWTAAKQAGGTPENIPKQTIAELKEEVAEICNEYPLDDDFYQMMKWIGKKAKII